MPRLCFIALLLLTSWVARAAADSSVQAGVSDGPCVASLPRAQAGTYGGYCYETVVANSNNESAPLPLVIGLHWSGSTPAEFREVLSRMTSPARLVLVRGTQVRRAGFSFYPVEPYYYDMDESQQRAVQLAESERMAALAREVSRQFHACGRLAVVGASQGGDLTYLLGLRHPEIVGLAIPLLATIDRQLVPDRPARRIPIHAMHGIDDTIVPVATARRLAETAKAKGFEVALTTFPHTGHDITDAMKSNIAAVVDAYLKSIECAS